MNASGYESGPLRRPKKRKENLKDFLLVCATALEMRAAVSLLPGGQQCDLSAWEQGAPLPPPQAPLPRLLLPKGGVRLLVCGVGPVASALSLTLAAGGKERKNLAGVLNMGIAGSYDLSAAPVGEAVLVEWECLPEYGIWPESDETVEHSPAEAVPGMPLELRFAQAVAGHGPVFSRLPLGGHNALGNLGLNCHTGLCAGGGATLAGVSGTRRRACRIRELTGALLETMEGFALALGAAALQLPFAEIRSVSNEAGRRPPHTWNFDAAAQALGRAAQTLFAPLM